MVHIYHNSATWPTRKWGYERLFSYISLFTFSMLMLVMSNIPAAVSAGKRGSRFVPADSAFTHASDGIYAT